MDTEQGDGPADEADPTRTLPLESLRLARAAIQELDWTAALVHLEAASAEYPNNLTVQMELGRVLNALKRPAEAEAAYRRVLEQAPEHDVAHFRIGQIAQRRGDLTQALSHLEAAAAEDPESLRVQLALATTFRKLDRPADVERVYRRVLELDPTNAPAQLAVGKAEWVQGHRSDALAHFQSATANEPADPKLNLALGNKLLGQWQAEGAEAAFRRVIAAEPSNAAAFMGLGRCALVRGDEDDALTWFRAAAVSEPGNQRILAAIRRLDTNHPAYDWKSELHDAAEILRVADSPREDRFWAAQLLLAYGMTDVLEEAFGPLEKISPGARRLLQMARQLDRMGLSQPSGDPGQNADPETEQLNALTGFTERLTPGAETLVLVFCGRLHRVFLSLDILHRILRNTGASLVYLRDLERTLYLGGVVGLGDDFAGTVDAFRAIMARSGARRLLMIGNCIGCVGALRFGLALGAEAVLGVKPLIGATAEEALSPRRASRLEALRNTAPQLVGDLPSLYLAAAAPPRVTLISGAGAEPEASFARDMSAKVPGVISVEVQTPTKDCLNEILALGLLTPMLMSFVAEGAVAPDVLGALALPASKKSEVSPERHRAGTEDAPSFQ
jgi:tetratricopeptide (TPR) repeat protein